MDKQEREIDIIADRKNEKKIERKRDWQKGKLKQRQCMRERRKDKIKERQKERKRDSQIEKERRERERQKKILMERVSVYVREKGG